ncbi:hypothetical protein N340_05949, partial [Tauraco erythrolophus]
WHQRGGGTVTGTAPHSARGTRLGAGTRKRHYLPGIHAFYEQPCSQTIPPPSPCQGVQPGPRAEYNTFRYSKQS